MQAMGRCMGLGSVWDRFGIGSTAEVWKAPGGLFQGRARFQGRGREGQAGHRPHACDPFISSVEFCWGGPCSRNKAGASGGHSQLAGSLCSGDLAAVVRGALTTGRKMGSPQDDAYRLLNEYSNGFMVSQVLFAACELGVFDLLAQAPGPLDSAAAASRLGCSPHGTELLLDTCAALKLLKVEVRGGRAFYRNSELSSTYLASGSPTCQRNMLLYMARTTYRCWAHLAEAVREGKNRYLQVFGVPSEELFSAIYRSDAERLRFTRGLQEVWSVAGRSVLAAFDLSPFPLVCDLGGGSGALARECASLYPGCQVTVFDIPEVVRAAREHGAFPAEGRVGFREGGGLLVVESLLDEDGRGPLTTQLYSLNMLVQTEGRERTPSQYRALLASAGFHGFQFKKTGGIYDAILARN
nr:acetylserotonin O-methyltransferase [Microcebus murinus]